MAKGNGRNGKKRNGKGFRKGKPLSKSQLDVVKSVVDTKLDAAVEDKYSLDPGYTNLIHTWDIPTRISLQQFTPIVSRGDDVDERTGLRISPKFMRFFLRWIPQGYNSNILDLTGNPPVTHSSVPPKTPLEVFFFRMPRLAAATFALADIRQAVNIKWRPKGVWKQDYLTAELQDLVKSMRLIHKTTLPALYSNTVIKIDDAGPGATPRGRGVCTPLAAYKEVQFKLLNKKLLYQNEAGGLPTNVPANYVYYIAMRVRDDRVPIGYYNLADPFSMEYRKLFVFEDA